MSVERRLFTPVERAAAALHPYRLSLALAALGLSAAAFALAFLGYLGWPDLFFSILTPHVGAPLLFTLVTWAWSAFLLSVWFRPTPQRHAHLPEAPVSRVRAGIRFAVRLWSLVFLALFFLSPVLLRLLLWHDHR